MTTQLATEQQAETVSEIISADGMRIVETVNGAVTLVNTEYVTEKTVFIITKALESPAFENALGHGLFSIVFRVDDRPYTPAGEPCTWLFNPDAKSAVCNLRQCIEFAFLEGLEGEIEHAENLNVRHAIWRNIIQGLVHETHHGNSWLHTPDELRNDPKAREAEEDKADEYEREFIYELARTVNIEPEFSELVEGMFAERWALTVNTIEDNKEPSELETRWLTAQKYMAQSGDCWFVEADKDSDEDHHILASFKEFLHFCSGDADDDEAWGIDTSNVIPVQITQDVTTQAADGTQGVSYETDGYEEDMFDATECVMPEATGMPCAPAPGMQGVATNMAPTNVQPQGTPQVVGQPLAPNAYQQEVVAPVAGNVPTPPAVNQPVAPMAQAPMSQTAPVVPGEGAYQAPGMDVGTYQTVVKGLYAKLSSHIFDSCGFNPAMGPGQPFFMQSAKIADMIPLTPEEASILKEMTCYDAQGQKKVGTPVDQWVSGVFIDKAGLLPGFELTLSDPNGNQIRRKILPQNPWKFKNGTQQYSSTALEAQQGGRICWVIDPDSANKQFATRIYNGALQSNTSGRWTTV